MNFLDVQNAVRGYHSYDAQSVATKARLDVAVPVAVNNARLWAERKNNWAYSFTSAWFAVDAASGASLLDGFSTYESMLVETPVSDVQMRSVQAVFNRNDDGSYTPLLLRPLGAAQRLTLQRDELRPVYTDFPPTAPGEACHSPYATVHGTVLNVLPATARTVKVEGYRWMANYVDNNDSDFFLTYVPDVIIWKAVLDCNFITQIFVPRQDGNVGAPKDMLAEAWDSAMDWDAHQHQGGINYELG